MSPVHAAIAALLLLAVPAFAQDKLQAPSDSAIAAAPNQEQITLGKRLLSETKHLLPGNVGASVNCTSCHLYEGKLAYGSPFTNSSRHFPSYNPRAGRTITLAERINGCFLRSMNGTIVPEDSKEMQAMLAYIAWLAHDVPAGAEVAGDGLGKVNTALKPDPQHGAVVYADQCASCHGVHGEGVKDRHGEFIFPPLWGEQSFNVGAGMARTMTAAAFVKQNMPIGFGINPPLGQGEALSDQDAIDVAEYFTHQPRPDFAAKVDDWPKGGKPKDSRY